MYICSVCVCIRVIVYIYTCTHHIYIYKLSLSLNICLNFVVLLLLEHNFLAMSQSFASFFYATIWSGWNPFFSWWDEKLSFHMSLCRTRSHPSLRAGGMESRAGKLWSCDQHWLVEEFEGFTQGFPWAEGREKPLRLRKTSNWIKHFDFSLRFRKDLHWKNAGMFLS